MHNIGADVNVASSRRVGVDVGAMHALLESTGGVGHGGAGGRALVQRKVGTLARLDTLVVVAAVELSNAALDFSLEQV